MQELAETLLFGGGTSYLACDGATMPNVKNAFASIGLPSAPLFYGSLDPEIIENGPWLIAVEKAKLVSALRLANVNKVGVCWVAENSTFDSMVRHLRSLNQGKLPSGALCYFRHYDPDALAWLVERLDGEQAARLFGPARMVGFASGFAAGATVERPTSCPSLQQDQSPSQLGRWRRSARETMRSPKKQSRIFCAFLFLISFLVILTKI